MAAQVTPYLSAFFNVKGAQQALFDVVRQTPDDAEAIERKASILCWCLKGNDRAIRSLKLTLLQDDGGTDGKLLRNNPHLIRSLCERLDERFLRLAGYELLLHPGDNPAFKRMLLMYEQESILETNCPPPCTAEDRTAKGLCYKLMGWPRFNPENPENAEIAAQTRLAVHRLTEDEAQLAYRRWQRTAPVRFGLQLQVWGWYAKAWCYALLSLLVSPEVVFVAMVAALVMSMVLYFMVSHFFAVPAMVALFLAVYIYGIEVDRRLGPVARLSKGLWDIALDNARIGKHLQTVLDDDGSTSTWRWSFEAASAEVQRLIEAFRKEVRRLGAPTRLQLRRQEVNRFAGRCCEMQQQDKARAVYESLGSVLLDYKDCGAEVLGPNMEHEAFRPFSGLMVSRSEEEEIKAVLMAINNAAGRYYPSEWQETFLASLKSHVNDDALFERLREEVRAAPAMTPPSAADALLERLGEEGKVRAAPATTPPFVEEPLLGWWTPS